MAKKIPTARAERTAKPQQSENQSLKNAILLGLPHEERETITPMLTFVELTTGTVLNDEGAPIQSAYFINSGLASVLNVMGDGKMVEVGLAGKDGFIGLPLAVGFSTSSNRVVMQVAGSAFRISAADFRIALKTCPSLERTLSRYSQELGIQATQVAACNRLHEVSQRLARWLLMSQDRLGGNLVPLTQEFLAHMLGTRRASVTVAAGVLQKAGLIAYKRGSVTVKNRRGLEGASCECYKIITRQARNWQSETAQLRTAAD